jgi:hypothetical protein
MIVKAIVIVRPGGLNSRDKSRSIFLDVSRCPFSKCRDFLDMSRQAFGNIEIESLDRDILKIETCQDFRA